MKNKSENINQIPKDECISSLNNCSVVINIETANNINIYNCSKSDSNNDCDCKSDPEQSTTVDGFCIPISPEAKPKQSQRKKLDRLLKNNTVPSAFAASFIHTIKRYTSGKSAGSDIELVMFEKFRKMSPEMKKTLKCIANSADGLPLKYKNLFADSLMQDINVPVDAKNLGIAFEKEITTIVSGLALGKNEESLKARPGKVRLVEYGDGDDVYPSQIHIFKINNFRTDDNIPLLAKSDFLPSEFQQVCTPRISGEVAEWDCKMQLQPCDGNSIDGGCLLVQQIQSGTSITIEGVNFFDINAKIHLRQKQSNGNDIIVDAFVYGDIDTSDTELINGQNVVIADSRVHDKIFFTIPADTPSGIYEFEVVVPNSSTFHGAGFGDTLTSNPQYLDVTPPSTARYQISSEQLWCRKETAPQSWGSDEVGVRITSIPIFDNLSLGDPQETTVRFDDVDSGEPRVMEKILFTHGQPIAGAVMSVIGFEIDGEEAYANQITEWTDIFIAMLKEQWVIILGSSAIPGAILKELVKLGFWGFVIIGIAIAITLAIDLIVALWAPADLIIEDTLAFSASDLARLTNINIPSPQASSDVTIYTTPGDIKVRLMWAGKNQFEYREQRGYLSDDEDSWYNITLRYNRLA